MNKPDEFVWTPSSATDITKRWRELGWVPPSEQPEVRAKWEYYRSLPMREVQQ